MAIKLMRITREADENGRMMGQEIKTEKTVPAPIINNLPYCVDEPSSKAIIDQKPVSK